MLIEPLVADMAFAASQSLVEIYLKICLLKS